MSYTGLVSLSHCDAYTVLSNGCKHHRSYHLLLLPYLRSLLIVLHISSSYSSIHSVQVEESSSNSS
uniref:Uncharacterized protein n=1 Tax=uncultured marine virus TaxID=186617 RepID=A0A0F7L4J6_9VIRU|nr:hypothetical protein [uncultured marine virus]